MNHLFSLFLSLSLLLFPVFVQAQTVSNDDSESAEPVYTVVDFMPAFPGGQSALLQYLSDNLQYPAVAKENGIQGRALCQFVIEKDGSVSEVKVARSAGDPLLDKEALRVVQSMPKWTPGTNKGKPVRVKYTIPINFKL